MAADWRQILRRWTEAGLLDEAAARRIRAYEESRSPSQSIRWPVMLALALGGMMLAAGVLLFVSAHWDELSPAQRFTVVLSMVAGFHVGGAFVAARFRWLAITLHTVGTVALGAGIFLAGQIFNLEEHWPGGIMLWFFGAAIAWALLRDWTQGLLCAVLLPAWLSGEWFVATERMHVKTDMVGVGLVLLTFAYLSSRRAGDRDPLFRGLEGIGIVFLIPCAVDLAMTRGQSFFRYTTEPSNLLMLAGWLVALCLPMVLAFVWRGKDAWVNCVALGWVLFLQGLSRNWVNTADPIELAIYGWCALGAIGLILWGISESRPSRINLGVAAFAVVVIIYYFTDVWDKLGRAQSLIGLGVLFLWGGWALERTRRKLVARAAGGPQ